MKSRKAPARKSAARKPADITGARPGPLPQFIAPCLATLVDASPETDRWVHEIKFDGYRLQARIDGDKVQLLTRSGLDWTPRFGSIARSLRDLGLGSALLDGEVVIEDEKGATSFVELVEALRAGRSEDMVYFVFDLLHLDSMSLMGATLADRKALLAGVLKRARKSGRVRYSEHVEGEGPVMLARACKLNLEGIISKRIDRPYRSGRRDDWLKSKCIETDEFVIVGYADSTALSSAIGALALGYYERGRLTYAGRVGTGFNRTTAKALWKALAPLRLEKPTLAGPLTADQRRGIVWVRPELVAHIEYRAWTGDDLLRHAAFKGLREDKPAREVRRPKVKSVSGL